MEVTFVYGFNHPAQRLPLWDFLSNNGTCSLPWMVLGDMNCVRTCDERISSDPPNLLAMNDFNEAIGNAGLEEMRTHGCGFTWTNKQDFIDRKWMRLDRVLANAHWFLTFPDSSAEALTAGLSDQSPLIISLGLVTPLRKFSFKYLNCWGQDQQFTSLVAREWQSQIQGCAMYQLFKLQQNPTNPTLCQEEKDLSQALCKLKNIELNIVYQRAKAFEVKMGDANTSYFFSKVATRRNASNISKVVDVQGQVCTTPTAISHAFIEYYTGLLGSEEDVVEFDSAIMANGRCLTVTEGLTLLEPVTPAEVKAALFSIDPNKSPGPDGFSSGFFKYAWGVIHDRFTTAILDFLSTGKLLKEVNSTLISLIPKGNDPTTVLEYRPISCCTTIYKTINKILTARLKKVMPLLVGKEQASFVADRSIFDNTMLASEMVRGYGRKYKTPRCVVKVDIRKAFDTVNWKFLQTILPLYGLPTQFCNWITTMVTSLRFSLKINGSTEGYFMGKRGLSYHPKCVKLDLTHLIFADDLLVFVRGDLPSVMAVKHCLDEFSSFSGLTSNTSKTNIYFTGVSSGVKVEILHATGFVEGSFPFKYLGTPLHSSRLTRDLFQPLLAKIKGGWGPGLGCTCLSLGSWTRVCSGRLQGGFDIREILSWNKTLLLKMFWSYNHNCTSIWMVWSSEYIFNHQSCWLMDADDCSSPIWKQILLIRDEFVAKVGSRDVAQWLFHEWHEGGKFPLQEVYTILRGTDHNLRWMKALMNAAVIPKHAFVATLAAHHALATIENIRKRGVSLPSRCVLCYDAAESNSHLFFECSFSKTLMQQVLNWQGVCRRVLSLKHELYRLSLNRGKGVRKRVACCAVAAAVYHIWQERNRRIFEGRCMVVDKVPGASKI
ncbi:uncharacterized protein LOC141628800 [Silene latifolia]|uniref:uncharacterized protein LOC141628800 n=1 Tax=Silene latifolia TaxID=37657 RepID=UPI003D77E8A7